MDAAKLQAAADVAEGQVGSTWLKLQRSMMGMTGSDEVEEAATRFVMAVRARKGAVRLLLEARAKAPPP